MVRGETRTKSLPRYPSLLIYSLLLILTHHLASPPSDKCVFMHARVCPCIKPFPHMKLWGTGSGHFPEFDVDTWRTQREIVRVRCVYTLAGTFPEQSGEGRRLGRVPTFPP